MNVNVPVSRCAKGPLKSACTDRNERADLASAGLGRSTPRKGPGLVWRLAGACDHLIRHCNQRRLELGALIVLSMLVTAIQASPTAQRLLEFDRQGIAAGQWWRILTGNFVHYGWVNLAANAWSFVVLYLVLWSSRAGALRVAVLSAAAVGVSIYLFAGGIATYRGLSGIDYALAAWVLMDLALRRAGAMLPREAGKHARTESRLRSRRLSLATLRPALWLGVLGAIIGKAAFEACTGTNLLPTSAPAGVAVVGASHLGGLAVGIAAGLLGAIAPRVPAASR